ncbi:holo-[acyl-carrier-protein] synthase [Spiroplasma corruscae]|uniref:Holo-[acyl-carrier-protein] synthase n=2 Tax=Spiroplasma corruscae TaxID=216934 RepID=A0A222ENF9_9MOLU|nr:4'-phosphopantetheinyl transferase superfamily protein [Spiroplasma corruscae]ASP28028.1 holo-[acyl-carrier-protein] synthase [Spiroplasma corruscae]
MSNVGIDIIEIKRIKLSDKFINKILHEDEIQIIKTFNSTKRKKEFLAGRWAAKESIQKIFDEKISMSKINIGYKNEKPTIFNVELRNVSLSISHEKRYCVAVAIVSNQSGG